MVQKATSIYLLRVNNRNTITRSEICSKLTIKTPERRHWRRSGIFIVNFKNILQLVLVFQLLTLIKEISAGSRSTCCPTAVVINPTEVKMPTICYMNISE